MVRRAYNGVMVINRRKIMSLLAATGVGSRIAIAQAPANPDAELQAARQNRLRDAQRVAMVKLPLTTEPAFRFRA